MSTSDISSFISTVRIYNCIKERENFVNANHIFDLQSFDQTLIAKKFIISRGFIAVNRSEFES